MKETRKKTVSTTTPTATAKAKMYDTKFLKTLDVAALEWLDAFNAASSLKCKEEIAQRWWTAYDNHHAAAPMGLAKTTVNGRLLPIAYPILAKVGQVFNAAMLSGYEDEEELYKDLRSCVAQHTSENEGWRETNRYCFHLLCGTNREKLEALAAFSKKIKMINELAPFWSEIVSDLLMDALSLPECTKDHEDAVLPLLFGLAMLEVEPSQRFKADAKIFFLAGEQLLRWERDNSPATITAIRGKLRKAPLHVSLPIIDELLVYSFATTTVGENYTLVSPRMLTDYSTLLEKLVPRTVDEWEIAVKLAPKAATNLKIAQSIGLEIGEALHFSEKNNERAISETVPELLTINIDLTLV